MAVIERLLLKYHRVAPLPLGGGVTGAITGALRLPLRKSAFDALLSADADPLVPLVTTPQLLQNLVLTVTNHVLYPDDVVAMLVKINLLRPNCAAGPGDVVVGFNNLSNSTAFADPSLQAFMSALDTVLNEPGRSVRLTNFIRNRTFNALRLLVRTVPRDFLADAFRIMADFHGTPHAAQLTQAAMPSWAKVLAYAPPNSAVSAGITFNAALLANHVQKHLCYRTVHGLIIPDGDEPCRWIDFLDVRDRIDFNWVRTCVDISDEEEAEIFDARGYMKDTIDAKRAFIEVLRNDDNMVDEYRTAKKIERDYEKVAIRTIRHGRKFVHYTPAGQIFITGTLNGVYAMARFVPDLGEFAISTAYLPTNADLLQLLAQWGPSTVWDLA